MKKVLITGASGFIGRHSIPFLVERGFDVHAVTRNSDAKKHKEDNCNWYDANLLDLSQVGRLLATIKPNFLLHFAWDVTPGLYGNSNENFRWLQASIELMLAFQAFGGKRIVMAGTCAEYDLKFGYCTESYTPLAPDSIYGLCKHSMASLLQSFSAKNNLSAAWGRVFCLYGAGEYFSRLVPSVICALLKNEPALCSHGKQIRDYSHVQDVAEAFVNILDSEVTGAINVCSGIPVSLKDIIVKIGEQLGRRELIRLGTLAVQADEPPLIVGNPVRLQTELSWVPRYSLDEGLAATIAWWKEYIALENK